MTPVAASPKVRVLEYWNKPEQTIRVQAECQRCGTITFFAHFTEDESGMRHMKEQWSKPCSCIVQTAEV